MNYRGAGILPVQVLDREGTGASPVKVGCLPAQSDDARSGNMGLMLATEPLGGLLLGPPFMFGLFPRV